MPLRRAGAQYLPNLNHKTQRGPKCAAGVFAYKCPHVIWAFYELFTDVKLPFYLSQTPHCFTLAQWFRFCQIVSVSFPHICLTYFPVCKDTRSARIHLGQTWSRCWQAVTHLLCLGWGYKRTKASCTACTQPPIFYLFLPTQGSAFPSQLWASLERFSFFFLLSADKF